MRRAIDHSHDKNKLDLENKKSTLPTPPPNLKKRIAKALSSNRTTLPTHLPLTIHIMDETTLVLQSKAVTILGRGKILGNPDSEIDVDLLPFEGFEKGVSKTHASILRESDEVFLVDLGSRNGTTLNGERMKPHELYQIRDGDTAYLSQLLIKFNFN